jgi:hypothetical protein
LSPPDEEGGGTARARLHDISRHFLSDDAAVYRIALCAVPNEAPALMADKLARALAGRGRTVACVDTDAGLISLIRRDTGHNPMAERLAESMRSLATLSAPDVMIVTTHASNEITACDLALFTVPAQASELRSAYLRLKALARSDPMPRIGITLTGTDDPRKAARCFIKLALAARDFLGIEIVSYAYLPDAADRHRTGNAMDDVARLLLEDRSGAQPGRQARQRDERVGTATHITTGAQS